jgi:hypothetical protein
MKKAILSIANTARTLGAVIMIGLVSVTYTGCKQEGCTDVDANNFSEDADEDDGTCTYDRDAFIGTYNNSTDNCISGTSFNMTIAEGAGAKNQINISNFGGFGASVSATGVVSGSAVTLQSGTLGSGISLLSGSGNLSGNLLTINYTYQEDGSDFTCTINATRSN